VYQGQLVIFIHTALNTASGADVPNNQSLGPLTLHWKIRMKEAAEKNQNVGNADQHNQPTSPSAANPLGWGTTSALQSTIASWSTLQFPSRFGNTGYYVTMPIGVFEFTMAVYFTTAPTADTYFDYVGDVAGIKSLNSGATHPGATNSVNNNVQFVWVRLSCSVPGEYQIFHIHGTGGGGTYTAAQFGIRVMPESDTTLLKHRDHIIRSLAHAKLHNSMTSATLVKKEIRSALQRAGLPGAEEEKEDPIVAKIQRRLEELRQVPVTKKRLEDSEQISWRKRLDQVSVEEDWSPLHDEPSPREMRYLRGSEREEKKAPKSNSRAPSLKS